LDLKEHFKSTRNWCKNNNKVISSELKIQSIISIQY